MHKHPEQKKKWVWEGQKKRKGGREREKMENCTSHLHGVMCALLFAIFQCSVRSEDRDTGSSPAHQLLNLAICLSKCPVMQFLKRGTLSTMPEWVIQQHMGRVNKESLSWPSRASSEAQAQQSVWLGGEKAVSHFQFHLKKQVYVQFMRVGELFSSH